MSHRFMYQINKCYLRSPWFKNWFMLLQESFNLRYMGKIMQTYPAAMCPRHNLSRYFTTFTYSTRSIWWSTATHTSPSGRPLNPATATGVTFATHIFFAHLTVRRGAGAVHGKGGAFLGARAWRVDLCGRFPLMRCVTGCAGFLHKEK